MNDDGTPRRCRIDLFTPAEKAIYEATAIVESVGADPLLTDAVVLLGKAQNKVADYVDRRLGDIERLKKFYGVATLEDLVVAQSIQVERLQGKLPPMRDEFPALTPRVG